MGIVDTCLNFDAAVEKLLKDIAEDQDLVDYKIRKSGASAKGDGYVGIITAIEISGTHKTEKKVLNLIVKVASKNDVFRLEMAVCELFEREIYMYNTVLPAFRKFQTEKGIPICNSFAKCYKDTIIDKSEALVLENLRSIGFKLWDRKIPMNEEHVALVMSEYGRFHALSFAQRDQEPERFSNLASSMSDIFVKFFEKSNFDELYTNELKKSGKLLNPEREAKVVEVYTSFVENVGKFLKNLPNLVDRYSVVLHGDGWTNNMMFCYEDADNPSTPTKLCFIDLQLARMGPPVLDLAYFFYACSSKDVINNFEHYLDIYYNSLSTCLKRLGSDSQQLYPHTVFRQHWKDFARFGLITATILIKVMLSEQDEVLDLADVTASGKAVSNAFDYDLADMVEYNDRIKHIILHLAKNKFI